MLACKTEVVRIAIQCRCRPRNKGKGSIHDIMYAAMVNAVKPLLVLLNYLNM